MNFEKLELFGFKSFADKTPVKFEEGITGIVGPNGCGKSNVADAIRWVLGEQSAKNLRGSTMQDVIFNGTENRKSLSYCEVSLYFNNADKHLFDVDYEHVIITRKLFRSGESEYLLNKEPCRLRDIIDLLHQCGIGKNGYTVIGQNKVTQIMNSKPEDRRAVFEEATGIAKNKSQKAESEKRLQRVKEELTRYNDLISEIESNLRSTERKAEKTRTYNKLAEELKVNEINAYIYKRDSVDSEKKAINDKIAEITAHLQRVNEQLEEVRDENVSALVKLQNSDNELRSANERFTQVNVGIEAKNGDVKVLKERIKFLKEQVVSAKNEISENDSFIREYDKTIQLNLKNARETEEKITECEIEIGRLNDRLFAIESVIREGDSRTDEINKKMLDSLSNLSDINLNKGSLSGELNAIIARKKEVDEKLGALFVKRSGLLDEKEICDGKINELDRKIFETRNAVTDKEDEIKALNEKSSELNNTIYNLNSNTTALVTRCNMLSGIKDNFDGYQYAVKRLMADAKHDKSLAQRIKGVVASLIRTDKKYEVAIETSLGGAVQNVVTGTPEDANFLIDYLKKTNSGRLTFLPVSSMKPRGDHPNMTSALRERGALGRACDLARFDDEYERVFGNLLGNTLIADSKESAVSIARKYSFTFKVVTLEGEVYTTQGSVSGGSRKSDFSGFLAGDRELDELQEKIKNARAEMDGLKAQRDKNLEDINKQSDNLTELNDLYSSYKEDSVKARERLTSAENALSDVEREIEEYQNLKSVTDARYNKLAEELEEVSGGTAKLLSEKDTASVQAEESKKSAESAKKEKDGLMLQISEKKDVLSSLKSEKEGYSLENVRLSNEIARLKNDDNVCNVTVENLNVAIEKAEKDLDAVAISKEDQQRLDAVKKEIEEINKNKEKLNARIRELEELRQNLMDESTNLTNAKASQEVAIEQVESAVKYLEGKVQENYMLDYNGALPYKVENFDVTAGLERIQELNEKIRNLGNIDAGAIEEYELINERYQDMLSQKQDIEKADSDLREGIDTLRQEILKTFNEGFKIINENFSKIFKELFGGGKAMLELDYTDCEDPLEAGVEIRAEPPGKKLQKISLLSGGEQALTTIAILFAILKYKPMPFCVLDEIEAALDDANVGRFASYLKKFSKETQFIVITHRKPTMELADSLFGVTMEEKGVSKTVSVKLSDAAQFDVQ